MTNNRTPLHLQDLFTDMRRQQAHQRCTRIHCAVSPAVAAELDLEEEDNS